MATAVSTRLRPIRSGVIAMPRGYAFRGEARSRRELLGIGLDETNAISCPFGAFLVDHPVEGPVLVDTGIDKNLGLVMGMFFRGLKLNPDETVPAQLRAWDVRPEEIRTVVMTHLHADHTSGMGALPNATFVTTREEWRDATARGSVGRGYVRAHLPAESSVRFVDFAGGEAFEGLERTIDLLGDGTIRLVSTPGHTPGHLSVLVATESGLVFIVGDAVYTLRNLREDILPLRTASDEDSRRSMAQLRAYADAHPDVPLVPTHDADAWDRLAAE